MFSKFYLIIAALCIISCGANDNQSASKETQEDPKKDTIVVNNQVIEIKRIPHDTLLSDAAKFMAGLETEKYYKDLQQLDFYKTHKEFTDSTFANSKRQMLEPIKEWKKEKSIGDDDVNATCFYPFSGPDFLFANTFFPHAERYLMFGLEPRGTFTDFNQMSESEVKSYLSGIEKSMKYLNTRGYFVTSHMSGDFRRGKLNGMVHMIMYMMAKTNHNIVGVYEVYLSETGEPVMVTEENKAPENAIIAINIDFVDSTAQKLRKVQYLRLDVADKNLKNHPEFQKYFDLYPNRVTYMKSASCVLFNTDFDIVRQLVLGSKKVLQDDTGIPYKYLRDAENRNTHLYGTYTSVISDLKWCIQKDLMKDLKDKGENTKLPFKISYNGNYDEGVMIWSVKKEKN